MEAKLTPFVRGSDDVDLQRFKAMLESPAFARFLKRVSAELDRAHKACDQADEELEVRRAQGAVAALCMVLVLPKAMLEEMKKPGAPGL